ncbi:MAG: hypothetical protein HYY45_09685 [Deltaproteobacteria bacterium]|nr:hypothetical protein [Deltaproteobacteria bacterium]
MAKLNDTTMSNIKGRVEEAIEPLKTGFEADGLRLEVGKVVEERLVTVNLYTSDTTCQECLLPESQMEALILHTLRKAGVEVEAVQVALIRNA